MPPSIVKTIRQEIYYEYAKLVSRSAFDHKIKYGFVIDRFKALCSGEITMSGTMQEWAWERELPRQCVFCGQRNDLHNDHLIPRSRNGRDVSDNMVASCRHCNTSRNNRGIYEWMGLKEKDNLHRLVAGKYLKQLIVLHEEAGTIDLQAAELAEKLCPKCRLPKVCKRYKTSGKLSCLCLESIIPESKK